MGHLTKPLIEGSGPQVQQRVSTATCAKLGPTPPERVKFLSWFFFPWQYASPTETRVFRFLSMNIDEE
jgi:hypothetical protein